MASFNGIGGVGVLGFISPLDTLDTYAVIDPVYGIDGLRNVGKESDLNEITFERRRSGMIVGTDNGSRFFKLKDVVWNFDLSDWEEIFLYTTPQSGITLNNITSGLVDYSSQTLTLQKNNGESVIITGLTKNIITGGTFDNISLTLSLNDNYGNTIQISGFSSGSTDTYLTGGTYSGGSLFLTNNTGGTFSITGFSTGLTDTYITGGTFNNAASTLTLNQNNGNTVQITGFSSSISVSANTGLGVSSNILYTEYNTLLDPSLQMASAVGGLSVGTTVASLTGKTIVSIFDDILFPTQQPTYTIPTITLNNSDSTVEVGSTYSFSLVATGTKNDAGNFNFLQILKNNVTSLSSSSSPTSALTTSLATQYGYSNPNNPNYNFTLSYSETYVIPTGITSSSTTYKARGNYLSGLSKKTNKGTSDTRTPQVRSGNAPQLSATTFDSTTKTITGIYPYYYGKMNVEPTVQSVINSITGGTATKVLASASGNITITYNANTEFLWFAHLGAYGTKTQWYVAADNKGSMSSSSLFDPGVTGLVSSELGYWANTSFYIYLGNYATTLNSITLGSGLF